jgi:hypothetical protein
VRYSGLSIATLKRWIKDPDRPLPVTPIGTRRLVLRSAYDAWAAGFRADPAPVTARLAADAAAIVAGIRGRRR